MNDLLSPGLPVAKNLGELRSVGWFSAGDVHFAELCAEGAGADQQALALVAASASRALGQGHPCVPLCVIAESIALDENDVPRFAMPGLAQLRAALKGADCVTHVEAKETSSQAVSARFSTPLVLDGKERLYVTRYFEHEQVLAQRLAALLGDSALLGDTAPLQENTAHLGEPEWLLGRLDHYFPLDDSLKPDLQRSAAAAALKRRFCVISGGPGTGKTSTVVKILALLAEQAEQQSKPLPVVQLMAPTGKAAARMMEAIGQGLASLNLPEKLRQSIAAQASTIHRALGVLPYNSTRFARGRDFRLRADVVLIDEASMVDLSLMRHLLDALRDDAQLILLGDRHQLASVDAGSVLSELCSALSAETGGALVELKKSYRFAEDSGISALATAIREGKGEESLQILRSGRSDLSFGGALDGDGGPSQSKQLRQLVVEHYGAALALKDPALVLEGMNRFRVLCAHRKGSLGIESMNELIREWLCAAALIPRAGEFYRGRLVLVRENDYGVGLRNGDVGLVWPDAEGRMQVLFAEESGSLRRLSPAQLPAHETAFASTIHKSQGSEHEVVVVILPNEQSPLLTRELVYTAVTRARRQAHLFGEPQALVTAASRTVTRHSGLGDACRARLHS